jgi:hypothetical protein
VEVSVESASYLTIDPLKFFFRFGDDVAKEYFPLAKHMK